MPPAADLFLTAPEPPPAQPVGVAEFAALADPLGPWPLPNDPVPVAVAVSGGADSLCLALLASRWRPGGVIALVVDHGLRPESAAEAALTLRRLATLRIPARLLSIAGLPLGPALASRARDARYAALASACREAGIVDLMLGHHENDQLETVLMRLDAASGLGGLAGMPALAERLGLRLVRPLLGVPPERLRATLRHEGVAWVEDPSNRDPRAERTRARARLGADPALRQQIASRAAEARALRFRESIRSAEFLAGHASLRPEGYALLAAGAWPASVLGALIVTVAGRRYPVASGALERLGAGLRACTLGGVRLLPAGRAGRDAGLEEGWMMVREAGAVAGPVPAGSGVTGSGVAGPGVAGPGVVWDHRFELRAAGPLPRNAMIGAFGSRRPPVRADLPSAVLAVLPALWLGDRLLAMPAIGWRDVGVPFLECRFTPRSPASASGMYR
ncbi:tRNA lysidine(34) synthetase TilS [Rhizosaccharibacter radicis]|uniref:tRNA(Ile)-lysidine synthase n=1 Tax=Rhizosaccharibacter radicis TaxID=2782605 RepID=A0ABT1VVP5_9PROT|nr:tRNA lysidine(34) synthetase TilS [Acetobacteraceae bacterium KSS12]